VQVCWEKIQANAAWVLFICRHGVCADCYAKLLLHPASALCPLCRMPLMQPRVTAAAPGETSMRDPFPTCFAFLIPIPVLGAWLCAVAHHLPNFEYDLSWLPSACCVPSQMQHA
jgi:hypothetical protein